MPSCAFAVRSVRQTIRMWLALWAYEHHIFDAVRAPTRRSRARARVFSDATSEPASGSDIAIASVPPSTTRPSRSRFCSSVPKRLSAPTTISVTAVARATGHLAARELLEEQRRVEEAAAGAAVLLGDLSPYQPSSRHAARRPRRLCGSVQPFVSSKLLVASSRGRSRGSPRRTAAARRSARAPTRDGAAVEPLTWRPAAARRLEAVQLAQRDHHLVDLVGPVGDPQPCGPGATCAASGVSSDIPSAPCTCIARSSTSMIIFAAITLIIEIVLARGALALGVHLPGGVQHHQPRARRSPCATWR